ncbi:MAG: 2-dehydropantoate 2-reductase [Clostridia bacterium]|nr:2-dehydropantoate 2-reductase [Clostridia bacterium]
MRVAIFGVGSLGTIVGALMTKNGIDVTLIDANRAHVEALNEHGATIIGKMDLKNQPVHAILPEQMEGIYDIIYLLTKQTVNHIVLPQIAAHMDENSVLCTLQNGAPEELVAQYIGKERTVGGVTGWGAEYIGPGVSQLSSDPFRMVFEIGELDGSITPRIEKVAEVLRHACEVHVIENLMSVRWTKLCNNGTMSGLSAALGCTFGDVVKNDESLTIAAYQANEIIKVATARGIRLQVLFAGWDFYDLLFHDKNGLEKAKKWLYDYFMPDDILIASMLRDMRNGTKCEVDQILGVIADSGDRVGVDTPCIDTCRRIIKEYEAGIRPLPEGQQNLCEFHIPEL